MAPYSSIHGHVVQQAAGSHCLGQDFEKLVWSENSTCHSCKLQKLHSIYLHLVSFSAFPNCDTWCHRCPGCHLRLRRCVCRCLVIGRFGSGLSLGSLGSLGSLRSVGLCCLCGPTRETSVATDQFDPLRNLSIANVPGPCLVLC